MATSAALVHSPAGRAVTTGQSPLQQLQSDLIARADRNDYEAALQLGMGYTCGHFGLRVNYGEAKKYLKIAALGLKERGANNSHHLEIGDCARAFAIQYKARLTDAFVQEIFGGRVRKDADNYASSYGITQPCPSVNYLCAFDFYNVELHKNPPEYQQDDIDAITQDINFGVENSFMPTIALSGILFCEGTIITDTPDIEKGLALLKKAAIEGGDAPAKVYLAEIFSTNKYGIKNLKEAQRWAEAAVEQNAPDAGKLLNSITKKMKASCTLL